MVYQGDTAKTLNYGNLIHWRSFGLAAKYFEDQGRFTVC
jgi:hypothetical protein